MSISENSISEVTPVGPAQSKKEILTGKISACAVSLGVSILKDLIDTSKVSVPNTEDLSELITTAIIGELQL